MRSQLFRLENLIVFENDITPEDVELAERADIKLYTLDDVIS